MPYKDPIKQKQAVHASYLRNREAFRLRAYAWKRANPDKVNASHRAYKLKLKRLTPLLQTISTIDIGSDIPIACPCCERMITASWEAMEKHVHVHTVAQERELGDLITHWRNVVRRSPSRTVSR